MKSLLDPTNDDEEDDEPEERWYAVIMYDDATDIWRISDHSTKEEAMDVLRGWVYDNIGGNDEGREEDDGDGDYWQDIDDNYMRWTLEEMNEYLPSEDDIDTVFCKKGGTE